MIRVLRMAAWKSRFETFLRVGVQFGWSGLHGKLECIHASVLRLFQGWVLDVSFCLLYDHIPYTSGYGLRAGRTSRIFALKSGLLLNRLGYGFHYMYSKTR